MAASNSLIINTDNEEENFLNSDRVVSIVNLLQKFKIKLWELASFELPEHENVVNDVIEIAFSLNQFSFNNVNIGYMRHVLMEL